MNQKSNKICLVIFWVVTALVVLCSGAFVVKAFVTDASAPVASSQAIDYTEEEFETALNQGVDTTGKTVKFAVRAVKPDSICGYNLWSGVHLNFCSTTDPGATEGDELTVKVISVTGNGSYFINYEIIEKE